MRRLIDAAALVAIASFTLVFGTGFLVGMWCAGGDLEQVR